MAATTAYNFDLLDLADGESGDAAVSVVVDKTKKKKKTAAEAAAAKAADPARPASSAQGAKPKFSFCTLVPLDAAVKKCRGEREKLRLLLKKLGAEEKNLKMQPANEARLEEVRNEQQKLWLEMSRLLVKERMTLLPERDAFYEENGIPLPDPKPNPEDALRMCRQDQKICQVALFKLKDEETNLKGQPGSEARLKEILAEQQKLNLERCRLRVKERLTLVPERDATNGIPLPEPKPTDDALRLCDDALRICRQDQKVYRDFLLKLKYDEENLKGQPGSLKEISYMQKKLRPEQKELWEEERRLLHQRNGELLSKCLLEQEKCKDDLFKLEIEETNLKGQPGNEACLKEISDETNKLRLDLKKLLEEEKRLLRDGGYSNNDGASSVYSDYDEYQTQLGDGGDHYYPRDHDERQVDRQGYRQRQPKITKKYVPKPKASSDAGAEAEEKPEENVVSATNKEQNEASAGGNAEAVPASGSDKSAGGAAQEGSKKGPKNTLSGSEKRKKKNAKRNSGTEPDKVKKQDSEVDGSTDKQPPEEEQKTLAEYEKMREEKKKALEASKTEVRKVTAEEFKNLKLLERKKLDDDEEAVIKVEKAQPKVKEASRKEEAKAAEGKDAAAKDGKAKKVMPAHEILSFNQPRRFTVREDGSSARARFNGGRNSNDAPRGAYNGRGDGAPRGDYSGVRGNGGYGYGRGHGGDQGNGYQQRRQGGDAGNGGYQQQRQGGNVERAGDGGYHQQRNNYPGRDGYYQQRGNSGDRRNSHPVINVEDTKAFPVLPAPASAKSAAPTSAPAPVPAQASAPAAAPAQAA